MIKHLRIPLRKTEEYQSSPLSRTMLATSSTGLDLPLNDVVIVFACSENFVPYLSVAIQSIVDNASENRNQKSVSRLSWVSRSELTAADSRIHRTRIRTSMISKAPFDPDTS